MTADLPDAGGLEPLIGSWTVEAEFAVLGDVWQLDFWLPYRRTG